MNRGLRRALGLLGVVGLLATGLVGGVTAHAQSAPVGAAKAGDVRYQATRTLTRRFVDETGSTFSFGSHKVSVTADQTRNLRGRQRIEISWTGAQPSAGRASNPYGENGMLQEYPVMIMQCRGRDDSSLPAAMRLSPQTCWTTSVAQRSQITRSPGDAAWTHDLAADPADKERVSGMDPFPSAEECPAADIDPYYTRLTPFNAAGGTTFSACDAQHMPPEAAVGAAFPPAEVAAFTDQNGRGSVLFEVRTDVENESLGCSNKVACSIVVIPIVGLSCDRPSTPPTTADNACRKGGRFTPGSSNFTNDGVDQAVSPSLWWSASNWKNRFSIPITFGLPPDTCDILDPRPPTGFYGSELLAQAALQWAPAYCLDKKRFKFQLNQMSDASGWNLMEAGGGAAAVVSSQHERRGADQVGYAPTAVTGFGIGYLIDKPDNAGIFTNLRLNPRLLAKLLTQSYLGSDLGRAHPGIGENPLALTTDPEFAKLNPRLSRTPQEAAATLLSLSNSSDVIQQLTEYIAQDKEATSFIKGKADPWGMRVNPKYRGISLPRPEWPMLDTYVPKTQNTCRQDNPAVYFTQLAAPVTTLRKVAEALLDAWPNVQTRCEFDQSTQQFKLGRIDRQSYGSRFMLGVVSLGDAARYGLRSAALETSKGRYVAPDDGSLAKAVGLADQKRKHLPFVTDQSEIARAQGAYPGAMIVYTAARLQNLNQADADKVAQFMRTSVTEGQRPGSGNGQLPAGFLPIRKNGVTAKLYRSAQEVADAVEAQRGPGTQGPGAGSPASPSVTTPTGDAPPAGDVPPAPDAAKSAMPHDTAPAPLAMPATEAASTRMSHLASRALLVCGLIVGIIGVGLKLALKASRDSA